MKKGVWVAQLLQVRYRQLFVTATLLVVSCLVVLNPSIVSAASCGATGEANLYREGDDWFIDFPTQGYSVLGATLTGIPGADWVSSTLPDGGDISTKGKSMFKHSDTDSRVNYFVADGLVTRLNNITVRNFNLETNFRITGTFKVFMAARLASSSTTSHLRFVFHGPHDLNRNDYNEEFSDQLTPRYYTLPNNLMSDRLREIIPNYNSLPTECEFQVNTTKHAQYFASMNVDVDPDDGIEPVANDPAANNLADGNSAPPDEGTGGQGPTASACDAVLKQNIFLWTSCSLWESVYGFIKDILQEWYDSLQTVDSTPPAEPPATSLRDRAIDNNYWI